MTESWPPVGARFMPADDVLITHYLANQLYVLPLPVTGAVMEADVYGPNAVPCDLFRYADADWQTRVDSCGKLISTESVRYVFTRLSKVGNGTKQRSRIAAGGSYWHGNNSEPVIDENGQKVGTKRTFKFKHGSSTVRLPADTVFIMHEYSTHFSDERVLCKIKMIKREKRKGWGMDQDQQGKKSRSDHQSVEQGNQNSVEEKDMDLQNFFKNSLY